jgi:hypothetical protein
MFHGAGDNIVAAGMEQKMRKLVKQTGLGP